MFGLLTVTLSTTGPEPRVTLTPKIKTSLGQLQKITIYVSSLS